MSESHLQLAQDSIAFRNKWNDKLAVARTVYVVTKRRMDKLSAREREVLDYMQRGYLNKIIALKMDISVRTVENVRARALRKLEVDSANAAMWALGQYETLHHLFWNE